MTTRGTQEPTVGNSIQILISGVEDVLRTAGPARDQLIGLKSYMRQLQTQDVEEELKALRSENNKLRNELIMLKSSGCESLEKVFGDLERGVRVAKEEAYKIMSSNEEAKTVMEELEEIKKKFEDQNEKLCIMNEENCSLHGICEGKEKQISSLRTEFKQLQTERETMEKSNENNLKRLQDEIHELNATFSKQKKILEDHLENTTEKYDALVKETLKLQTDLPSARLQNTKENIHPDVEDYSDSFDPRMVAELYKTLYDHHWPDAYEEATKLFNGRSERFIVEEVRKIFEKADKFCKEELDRQKLILSDILKEKSVDRKEPHEAHVIKLIKNGTTDFSLGLVAQAFCKEIAADYNFRPKIIKSSPIFTRECVKICWLANLCEPPISFYTKNWGDVFDENFFREYTCKGKKFDFVVMPALVHADGHLVAKGVVQYRP